MNDFKRLGSRWRIHHSIRGGLGVVHIVSDPEQNEVRAAKTFLGEVMRGDETVERFRVEAYTWVHLGRHPNVVEALEFEVIEGRPYLFIEYVSGGDLSDWIGTPRLTLNQALTFALQFCDGMVHAYENGLKVHRDIKPANCLITGDGRLKITDFGLAKIHRDEGLKKQRKMNKWSLWMAAKMGSKTPAPGSALALTGEGEGFGTCTHMAPEQFRDAGGVDHRADIYSFGVMLYEMLVGGLPYSGDNFFSFYYHHCHTEIPSLPSHFPIQLRELVNQCLAKKPEQRPTSFSELRKRLETIFREATGEDAPDPAAGAQLDALDLNDQGACMCRLGLYQEGIEKLQAALQLAPEMVEAWVNLAIILERQGKMEAALEKLQHAAALKPHSAAFGQLGVVLGKLGRYPEALEAFSESLRLDPNNQLSHYNYGLHLAGSGALQKAVEHFDRALELYPRMEQAWLGKGMALFNANDLVGSLRCMKSAVEVNPQFVDGWNYVADINLTLGKVEEASWAADRAMELDSNSALAWLHTGRVLVTLQRYDEALPKLNRALVLDPESVLGWYVLGSTLSMLEKYQEAVAAFDRALALDPQDEASYFNRGVALLRMGQDEAGIQSLLKAQDLGSGAARQALLQLGYSA